MEQIRLQGYFGGDGAKAREGAVEVSVSGVGMRETLQIDFSGQYAVMIPIRPLEQLAAAVRQAASGQAVENAVRMTGYYTKGGIRLRKGETMVWFRANQGFDMLSVEYENQGQISIPYRPVEAILKKARRNLV